MNRYQFEDLISEYIENELSLAKRKKFEAYLKANPDSAKLVNAIKDNIDRLNQMEALKTSESFNERLLEKIENHNFTIDKDQVKNMIFGLTPGYATLMMGFVVTFIFISLQLLMPKVDNQKIKNVHLTDNGTPAITNPSINHGIDQNQDMVHTLDDSTKTDSTIRLKKDYSKKIQFVND